RRRARPDRGYGRGPQTECRPVLSRAAALAGAVSARRDGRRRTIRDRRHRRVGDRAGAGAALALAPGPAARRESRGRRIQPLLCRRGLLARALRRGFLESGLAADEDRAAVDGGRGRRDGGRLAARARAPPAARGRTRRDLGRRGRARHRRERCPVVQQLLHPGAAAARAARRLAAGERLAPGARATPPGVGDHVADGRAARPARLPPAGRGMGQRRSRRAARHRAGGAVPGALRRLRQRPRLFRARQRGAGRLYPCPHHAGRAHLSLRDQRGGRVLPGRPADRASVPARQFLRRHGIPRRRVPPRVGHGRSRREPAAVPRLRDAAFGIRDGACGGRAAAGSGHRAAAGRLHAGRADRGLHAVSPDGLTVAPAEGVRTSDTGGRVLEAAGRVAWIAAALSAMVLLWSLSRHQPGWAMASVVCGLAVLSAARPFDGLLVLAGFGPVVTIFSVLLDVDNFGVHYPEALALAFISGAAARRAHERHAFAVPPSVVGPALVLLTAAVASAFTQVPVLSLEQPGLRIPGVPVTLATDYLVLQNRVTAAIGFAAGVVLFLLAADICGRNAERRDRVLVMMVAGAAGAGLLNVVRLVTAAMRREHAAAALWTYAMQSRINVQYPDWNAAGSHFAMMLVVTLALALTARRRSYLVPLILIGAGLWLTGSRTAMAAVLVAAVGVIILRQGPGRQRTIVALCAVATIAAVALAGWWWYPATRNDPAAFSLRTRLILWEAGIRMARDHPLFGVGIGGYWEFSHDYAPAFLDSFWRSHENAHNYFIQLLAELGIPGLMVFVGVIGASLRSAWAPAAAARMSPVWTAGLIAYLLTCLTGHPFLVPDATYPFWIALAVAA